MEAAREGGLGASQTRLRASRNLYLAENAVAAVIFSLGTGNFITGLLSWLGASPATCATVGAFPQLGCIMQLVSPFLFERLRSRKASIIVSAFLFRFLLGCSGVVALVFFGYGTAPIVPLYLVAFLMAGFVTPGLSQWIMDLAPTMKRGAYFARRDILASVVSGGVILLMGNLLDGLIQAGRTREGYLTVFATVVALSLIDAVLLTRIAEPRDSHVVKLYPPDLLRPLRDPRFQPVFLFIVLWFFTQNLSSGFLPVYQLTVLKLQHGMIATMTAVSLAAGITMSWLWGTLADRVGWGKLPRIACALMACAYCGWFLVPPSRPLLATALQCVTVAGNSAYNMSMLNIQYEACPLNGKTAYLGVTAAVSNLTGYGAVLLSAQLQPLLDRHFPRAGIHLLFAASALGFLVCTFYAGRIALRPSARRDARV